VSSHPRQTQDQHLDQSEWNQAVRGESELQAVYLVTLVLAATSAALLIGPVGYHRTVFRQRLKAQLVATGHRYAIAGLVLLLLALVGGEHLAASFVIGAWATLLAAALAALFATLWFVVPLVHLVQRRRT